MAQLAHLLVVVEQTAFGIVERHSDEIGVENLTVAIAQQAVMSLFLQFPGNVATTVYDVVGFAILALNHGTA